MFIILILAHTLWFRVLNKLTWRYRHHSVPKSWGSKDSEFLLHFLSYTHTVPLTGRAYQINFFNYLFSQFFPKKRNKNKYKDVIGMLHSADKPRTASFLPLQ